jgi:hypothetical protein
VEIRSGRRPGRRGPEDNNEKPSFREPTRRNSNLSPLTLSVTGSNELSISESEDQARLARLRQAEGDERVF